MPDTAESIGRALGLVTSGSRVMTGEELEGTPDEELTVRLKDVAIYARVAPEQKLRVVRALQQRR